LIKRILLAPISLIYGAIVYLRNILYDKGIFKSSKFDFPIICVGNLSMGGTGKTPHTEYILRLLQDENKLATLSRGYGRRTSEFIIADESSTSNTIGDEPLQYFRKFKKVKVAVEKKRVLGILKLLHEHEDLDAIVLDDAFQHRALEAGFKIVLSDFNNPFFNDYILPSGELREFKKGVERADILVFTKCSKELTLEERNTYKKQSNFNGPIVFSKISYGPIYSGKEPEETIADLKDKEVLLITGIAKPEPLEQMLKNQGIKFQSKHFGDHYRFKKKDAEAISKLFGTFTGRDKIILTTEKDYSRMLHIKEFESLPIYCQPIQIEFLDDIDRQTFDNKLIEYVRENKGDREFPEE